MRADPSSRPAPDAPASFDLAAVRQRAIDTLAKYVAPGSTVALVDFPNHRNAGDSLIYLGQSAVLRAMGVRVAYVADIATFSRRELERCVPDGPILIQGGGNFGDRWTRMQRFREHIIATFPDRSIVQLPQSLDFTDPLALARTADVLRRHPRLVLLMREERSLRLAHATFTANTVDSCPDLAFGLGPLTTGAPHLDVVQLLRTDSERVRGAAVRLPDGVTTMTVDWHLGRRDEALWQLLRMPAFVARTVAPAQRPLSPLVQRAYAAKAALNLRVACGVIGSGRVVITDRLHATILGVLLGRPVVALDNANHKVHDVIAATLTGSTAVRMADDEAQAATIAVELLGTVRGR